MGIFLDRYKILYEADGNFTFFKSGSKGGKEIWSVRGHEKKDLMDLKKQGKGVNHIVQVSVDSGGKAYAEMFLRGKVVYTKKGRNFDEVKEAVIKKLGSLGY